MSDIMADFDIMIDLETLSTATNAMVIQIGAFAFDRRGLSAEPFVAYVDPESAFEWGRDIQESTWDWWSTTNAVLFNRILTHPSKTDLKTALTCLAEWIRTFDRPKIWAKSPSFDCTILNSAFDACGVKRPWAYNQERDVRTLQAVFGVDDRWIKDPRHDPSKYGEGLHDALYDAVLQTNVVISALSTLDYYRDLAGVKT